MQFAISIDRHARAILAAGLCSSCLPLAALADDDTHELELKAHGVYWADKGLAYPTAKTPKPQAAAYEQSALGLELNYRSPYFLGGVAGFDASVYSINRLGDSGVPTTQLVEVGNNGRLENGYQSLGQALLKLKLGDKAVVRLGRQFQDSLLLKSTTNRAVPDTYSGVSATLTPADGLKVYGSVYDQYRSRTTGEFVHFRTEASGRNRIDYIAVLGGNYVRGPLELTAEYLNARSYLAKSALIAAYTIPLGTDRLKLSGGYLTSRDAGSLFVCGAEKDMDCAGSGRISNRGSGAYVDVAWTIRDFTVGGALTKISGMWIEDNYAVDADRTGALTQDPGTNPFPTQAVVGPDFTNRDETAAQIRVAYDWKALIPGLKTAYRYVRGTGARSSNLVNNVEGREQYRELEARYALPFVKNVSLRYMFMTYDSQADGRTSSQPLNGLTRQDWRQHRFYIDYSYRF
jgi:hypothetical protein